MNGIDRLRERTEDNIREFGPLGVFKTASDVYQYLHYRAESALTHLQGTNIYEREWDVLVLLDCATTDMLYEVRDEYDFLTDIGEHDTPGTSSAQWMDRTFTQDYRAEMGNTLHVTANTSSEAYLDRRDFLHLEEVWRARWDEELGTIPARAVTDRAVRLARELAPVRTIVHYMQPHPPFVNHPDVDARVVAESGAETRGMNLNDLHEAEYSRQELWDLHLDNLRYVLDDVEVLLSNIEGRAIISADHGQVFGEQGVWGHPASTRIDALQRVPWCVTSATDTGAYEPEPVFSQHESAPTLSVDEKLEALGYR